MRRSAIGLLFFNINFNMKKALVSAIAVTFQCKVSLTSFFSRYEFKHYATLP